MKACRATEKRMAKSLSENKNNSNTNGHQCVAIGGIGRSLSIATVCATHKHPSFLHDFFVKTCLDMRR